MEGIGALTPRQREVLELIAKGLSNREIGGVLGVSPATVKSHVEHVLRALGVTNRVEAAALIADLTDSPGAFHERPAVAVMRFEADADPVATTFAAGFVDDLIALLCKWRWFPVIARSTSIFFDPSQPVSKLSELTGAAYLVCGRVSVRPGRLKISVRLEAARGERCLWADSCELPREDIFALQEEVASVVVAQAYPELFRAEGRRVRPSTPESLSPWQLAHEGLLLFDTGERDALRRAMDLFARSSERDDRFVLPLYGKGMAIFEAIVNQWTDQIADHRAALERCAERAIELDESDASGWVLAGRAALMTGQAKRAIPLLEKATTLNRSQARAQAFLGQAYIGEGLVDEGFERLKLAVRLSPRANLGGLALAYFSAGEYADAAATYREAVTYRPGISFWHAMFCAALALAGDVDAARAEVTRLLERHPGYRLGNLLAIVPPGRHDTSDRIAKGMRLAGRRE